MGPLFIIISTVLAFLTAIVGTIAVGGGIWGFVKLYLLSGVSYSFVSVMGLILVHLILDASKAKTPTRQPVTD